MSTSDVRDGRPAGDGEPAGGVSGGAAPPPPSGDEDDFDLAFAAWALLVTLGALLAVVAVLWLVAAP